MTIPSSDKLEPCPFCGSKINVKECSDYDDAGRYSPYYEYTHPSNKCVLSEWDWFDEESQIDGWNTRTPPPDTIVLRREEVERVVAHIKIAKPISEQEGIRVLNMMHALSILEAALNKGEG